MKIAKTSWHYRFNKANNENFTYRFANEHYTTCSYIRTTMASMFACLFKILFFLIVGCFVLFWAGSMIGVPIILYMGKLPYELPAIMCLIGWAAVAFALTVLFVKQVKEWIENARLKAGSKPSKEPNVFVQAIIDKHNKFCTLVTAED